MPEMFGPKGKPTRRQVLAAGAASASLLAAPAIAQTATRPNVLFISIDDLNDWISPLGGYPGVHTPNLARLAAVSRNFTNAHTSAPACSPARAGTLFGIEPHKSGIYTMQEYWWRNTVFAAHHSLPRTFKERGYRTFGTGKILHGKYWDPSRAVQVDRKAWSEFEFCDAASRKCRIADSLGDDADVEHLAGFDYGPAGELADAPDFVRATWMVKRVLSTPRRDPFFAALGLIKPHLPLIVPQEFFDLYDPAAVTYPPGALDPDHPKYRKNADTADLPRTARAFIDRTYKRHREIYRSGEWRAIIRSYLAAISFTDYCLGVVLDGLQNGPHAGNTIIVLWSDHGWSLGEKLSWQKFTLWERATHIPMMIAGPGILPGDSAAPVSSMDLYPTLMDLVFQEVPAHLDGNSLRPHLLTGKDPRWPALTTWALDHHNRKFAGPHFSVRTKNRRLIAYRNGDMELYDHRTDPYEWKNLAPKAKPSLIELMRQYVPTEDQWAPRNG